MGVCNRDTPGPFRGSTPGNPDNLNHGLVRTVDSYHLQFSWQAACILGSTRSPQFVNKRPHWHPATIVNIACGGINSKKKAPPKKSRVLRRGGMSKRRTLTSTGYSAYLSWRRLANSRPPNHFLWVSSGTQAHLSFVFTRGNKIHHLSEAPLSTETENWSGWGQVSELCPGMETSPMAPPSCPARLSKLPSSTAISLMFLTRCPACLSVTIQYRYPPPP